jgi:hypothetical protein
LAKTIASKKAALDASLCSLANPRLCLLTAVTAESLHDPAGWTEAPQYATTNRPDLAGKMPNISAATTNTGDSPDSIQVLAPTADLDCAAVAGTTVPCVAVAIVSGTAALSASTVGRIVAITTKTYQITDVPRFAAGSWTAKE